MAPQQETPPDLQGVQGADAEMLADVADESALDDLVLQAEERYRRLEVEEAAAVRIQKLTATCA